jgi:hypothetical protein
MDPRLARQARRSGLRTGQSDSRGSSAEPWMTSAKRRIGSRPQAGLDSCCNCTAWPRSPLNAGWISPVLDEAAGVQFADGLA